MRFLMSVWESKESKENEMYGYVMDRTNFLGRSNP